MSCIRGSTFNDEESYAALERWCSSLLSKERCDDLYDLSNKDEVIVDMGTPSKYLLLLQEGSDKFDLPIESIESILHNMHVRHIMRQSSFVKTKLMSGKNSRYSKRLVAGNEYAIIELACDLHYSPYLLARMIVDIVAKIPGKNQKSSLSEIMKGSSNWLSPEKVIVNIPGFSKEEVNSDIFLNKFSSQIDKAILMDPLSGPQLEAKRRSLGLSYERKLETLLNRLGLPYESEEELRLRGTAKTPDILLKCPVGMKVNEHLDSWRVVCWIDSKAMFGDVRTHNEKVISQAEGYLHRFGPGLVLYWFGHAPPNLLMNCSGDISVHGWDLPSDIMLPDGSSLDEWRKRKNEG